MPDLDLSVLFWVVAALLVELVPDGEMEGLEMGERSASIQGIY